jgi:DHA1 family bicyclomycin/chloramphenicol resistance-like MFS transporter
MLTLTPGHRAMTLLLGALIAIAPLAMDVYLASMPTMGRALGTTADAVQLTLSVYMFGWGAVQLFAGPLSDRFGRRPLLLAGLAIFIAASVACALSRTIGMLIASRFAQAVGMATVAVVPRAVVRDLHSGDLAAKMLSAMAMVLGIAPIVAPVLGSHLHVWFGWQSNFVFVAVYGAIAWICVALALPETLSRRDPKALDPATMGANFATLLRSRRYVGYLLVAAFTSSGLFAFLAGSAYVFVSGFGTGERGFGVLFATVMLGNITGAAIANRVVVRLGLDRLIGYGTWAMLAAGVSMAALAWARIDHAASVVVPMFVFMVAFMATMPQATAGALTPFPRIAGAAASLLSFAQFVVAATVAQLVGVAFDGTARPMATAIAVASLLSLVSFRALVQRS